MLLVSILSVCVWEVCVDNISIMDSKVQFLEEEKKINWGLNDFLKNNSEIFA